MIDKECTPFIEQLNSVGRLPKSLSWRENWTDKPHTIITFWDREYLTGFWNSLYGFFDENGSLLYEELVTEKNQIIYVPPDTDSILIKNPATGEYVEFPIVRNFDRSEKAEIKLYCSGYEQYLSVDYNHLKHWLWFDLQTYLHDKWGKVYNLEWVDIHNICLKIHSKTFLKNFFEEYENNLSMSGYPSCSGHIIGFPEPQEFYSFISDFNDKFAILERNSIDILKQYGELCNNFTSGKIAQEDFFQRVAALL